MSTSTLSQEIYDRLRVDIRSGTLEPRMPLRMEWLKTNYGIGATPLREALSRLSAEHLTIIEGGRGFRVAGVSLKDFEELISLRDDLERKALKDAIEKGDDRWEANIVGCYHRLSKMPWHKLKSDFAELEEREERHRAFHSALIMACDSKWLMRLWDQLSAHMERYRRICMRGIEVPGPVSEEIEKEHQTLMESVLDRDFKRAMAILAPHRRRTTEAVRKKLGDP
ncbi:MAG: FCD domain-containing protein [Rhodospirillales bacterium]|nr:FCD domain-containing protein [Rhodospirillales bacterium]